jgi:hypothetical protein
VADGWVGVVGKKDGVVTVTVSNFDDAAFTGVVFTVSGADGVTFVAQGAVPGEVKGNGDAVVEWKASRGGKVVVNVGVKYTNSRTGVVGNRSVTASIDL